MAGNGKRIRCNSHAYAFQFNHYDWAYPHEKWTVSGNKFMTVEEICQEEDRIQKQELANAQALQKQKHQMISLSLSLALEEEDDALIKEKKHHQQRISQVKEMQAQQKVKKVLCYPFCCKQMAMQAMLTISKQLLIN